MLGVKLPVDHKEALSKLIDNAFTYLEKGLSEFDQEINFALVHFYSGVELIVKACLLKESWKEVVDKPETADWNKFCSGMHNTVSLEDAAKRLKKINKPIEGKTAFKKLKIHRNQLMHFFHPALDTPTQKNQVAKELLIAWYYLHQMTKEQVWSGVFFSAQSRISAIDAKLQTLHTYLQAVFDTNVKDNHKSSSFTMCPVCTFQSLDPTPQDAYLDSFCLVCGFSELSHHAIKDGEDEIVYGHCLWCDGEYCVVPTSYGAKCTVCNESFTHLIKCEFCETTFAGHDLNEDEGNYQTGCSFCSGKLDYLSSKDD